MAHSFLSLVERFWPKVQQSDGCWIWIGAISSGYGIITLKHHNIYAHRFAYELLVGPIPIGLQIDHLCRNRSCVRPSHLEPVTSGENIRRGLAGIQGGIRQRSKTHCPKGHTYDLLNTRFDRNGGRWCKECKNQKSRDNRLFAKIKAKEVMK